MVVQNAACSSAAHADGHVGIVVQKGFVTDFLRRCLHSWSQGWSRADPEPPGCCCAKRHLAVRAAPCLGVLERSRLNGLSTATFVVRVEGSRPRALSATGTGIQNRSPGRRTHKFLGIHRSLHPHFQVESMKVDKRSRTNPPRRPRNQREDTPGARNSLHLFHNRMRNLLAEAASRKGPCHPCRHTRPHRAPAPQRPLAFVASRIPKVGVVRVVFHELFRQ